MYVRDTGYVVCGHKTTTQGYYSAVHRDECNEGSRHTRGTADGRHDIAHGSNPWDTLKERKNARQKKENNGHNRMGMNERVRV